MPSEISDALGTMSLCRRRSIERGSCLRSCKQFSRVEPAIILEGGRATSGVNENTNSYYAPRILSLPPLVHYLASTNVQHIWQNNLKITLRSLTFVIPF